MFKKIVFSLFIVFFSLPFLWFAWYCDWNTDWAWAKPPICYNSPEVVNKYLQDMVYVIWLTSNVSPTDSWLGALWNKLKDTWIWSLGVATMFASNGVWNFFQNFVILKEMNPDVVRDRVKITNFQQYITQKALKIASEWLLNQNINNRIKERIINYTKWKSSFVISFYWSTYKDLFKYLWDNQLIFENIYYDKIVLKENIGDIENNILNKNIGISINNMQIENLGKKFNVYKTECSTSWDDIKKDVKHIICSIWWDKLSKANARFHWNYRRLLYVLWLWGSADKSYAQKYWSVALAKTLSGSRFKAKVKVEWIWNLSYGNKNIKNGWNPDTASLNQMSKDLKKYSWLLNWIKEIWSYFTNIKTYKTLKWNISPADYAIESQAEFINNNLTSVINDYNDVTTNLAWVEPWKATHNITLLFPQISKQIDDIIKKVWKSVSTPGTIYKNIEKTCQNQSPNKWNCSYSP